MAVDDATNVYIADTMNHRIRMVDTNGIIHTIAGTGTGGYSGDGGAGTNASLALPHGVTVGGSTLYISDTDNNRVRVMTGGTALRGTPSSADHGDNPVRLEVTDGITSRIGPWSAAHRQAPSSTIMS